MIGIPIARILGIEIRVQLGWVIVLALIAVLAVGQITEVNPGLEEPIAWALGAVVAFGFFVSNVSHDLAHALVARRRGVDVRAIAVSFFGGATPFDPIAPDPGDDAAIAASGPITSLALGAILFALTVLAIGLGEPFTPAAAVLAVLVFLNVALGLVNLVPAYPMDGGRIVRDIAWRRSGSQRLGWQAAAASGRLTGWVIVAAGISYLVVAGDGTGAMVALIGWFLVLSANSVRDRVRVDELVGDRTVGDVMEADPATVSPTLTVDTFAAQLLDRESPVTAIPVVAGDEVVGLLGVAQVRRLRRAAWPTTRVEDVMARPPRLATFAPEQSLRAALETLQRAGLDGAPVLDDGRLVGVLTRRGIAQAVSRGAEAP